MGCVRNPSFPRSWHEGEKDFDAKGNPEKGARLYGKYEIPTHLSIRLKPCKNGKHATDSC